MDNFRLLKMACIVFGVCLTTAAGSPAQSYKILFSFDGTDGANLYGGGDVQPAAGLVQATDGNFYGVTNQGGTSSNCSAGRFNGCGTVFKITPAGVLTTLHSFDLTDGSSPGAALVQGTDGNFYGTTLGGGPNNGGTVFKISAEGELTTLYMALVSSVRLPLLL